MSKHSTIRRKTVPDIRSRKGGEPIVCLAAYTAPMAQMIDPYTDLILVGDSAANAVHGMDTTIGITLDHMITHGQAVMRGSQRALIVMDMPFGTYEESPEVAFRNACRLMRETGAAAVKLEGGVTMRETIAFLTSRGIPVMAHIGLMPQSVQVTGGYKITGRSKNEWPVLEADARAVEEAGAFAVVLEGMAEPLADKLTSDLAIPTIGIGASATCDGQILVINDLLGMSDWVPKFVKKYADLTHVVDEAVKSWAEDVKSRNFPGTENTYPMRGDD
ncbi:MAG: 3-methyl-2-oxobutanoate hydroxymethyltransferase [Alphaproteobacteria bacterium]|nr:MAG: 3-methyl-2-oxobutanoate hydroxymethyltransferase [Alphaproteobacteria bacterium]